MRARVDFPKAASILHQAITVASSVTQVASAHGTRTVLVLYNAGPETVYLSPRADVDTASGLPLAVSALWVEDRWDGVLYGIASGSSLVVVWDYV